MNLFWLATALSVLVFIALILRLNEPQNPRLMPYGGSVYGGVYEGFTQGEGAQCTASNPQQCASGCCFNGKCAPSQICFGDAAAQGGKCRASTWQDCPSSGCCVNGNCVDRSRCFGGNTGMVSGTNAAVVEDTRILETTAFPNITFKDWQIYTTDQHMHVKHIRSGKTFVMPANGNGSGFPSLGWHADDPPTPDFNGTGNERYALAHTWIMSDYNYLYFAPVPTAQDMGRDLPFFGFRYDGTKVNPQFLTGQQLPWINRTTDAVGVRLGKWTINSYPNRAIEILTPAGKRIMVEKYQSSIFWQ